MSPVTENDAIEGFLAFLVLVQAMMLYVIFRAPASAPALARSPAAEDGAAEATRPAPVMPPAPRLAAARSGASSAPFPPAGAAGQPGKARPAGARYAPRHAPESVRGTIRRSKVSGNPPWGPAPMPPRERP